MRLGLDIGSTTIKAVVMDEGGRVRLARYERHLGQIAAKAGEMLRAVRAALPKGREVMVVLSGSAGMGLAESLNIPFVQEVYATRLAVQRLNPDTDVVIELGGEDAKILFLEGEAGGGLLEVRMNGSCAGGTGAFIDQMATLMGTTPDELSDMATRRERECVIASRCGVFAKSDIQALLNQGVSREDIAAGIFDAVVNQTVAGLAQGRAITGNVLYLGGPLTFLPSLRAAFDRGLAARGVKPEHSLYYVAMGAAIADGKPMDLSQLIGAFETSVPTADYISCPPLFDGPDDYAAFAARHASARVERAGALDHYGGAIRIGIDAGSTTVKCVALDGDGRILMSDYQPSGAEPVKKARAFLTAVYERFPNARIAAAASTGYGENLMREAFRLDGGVVETVAHLTAAQAFQPAVDFILDIGGQDIKCFHIQDGVVDNIFLNEACSSGCGSFLETFANAWGYPIDAFAVKGLYAERPVDLGSRCTVFMNSSVKQAQKDGASLENVSAGLSISVVKNAIYKVIRAASAAELGRRIVVQGGTFLNDAVLRAFERETGVEVIRPDIAGLMGAYGAALYATRFSTGTSGMLSAGELRDFTHEKRSTTCGLCANHCRLTVNRFGEHRALISGNRCEKPTQRRTARAAFNQYAYQREKLFAEPDAQPPGPLGRIGLAMGLNQYELLPFWRALLTGIGFEVVVSPPSSHELYVRGQHTIPSDTVCYPAKIMHGHIEWLLDQGLTRIFYPCLSYNFDEGAGDNHYNCPVVAFYPELIAANVERLSGVDFIRDYFGLHRKDDFAKRFFTVMKRRCPSLKFRAVKDAVNRAYDAYDAYMEDAREAGRRAMREALDAGKPVIVLAGRPYHLDPEVNHGIDELIARMGAVVVSETAVSELTRDNRVDVLNQWTYHARLYRAAKAVVEARDDHLQFVQLVSFGCGMDAITTDEARAILMRGGKIYTGLKIDEITNLDAVRIRLRSLFAASGWVEGAVE